MDKFFIEVTGIMENSIFLEYDIDLKECFSRIIHI